MNALHTKPDTAQVSPYEEYLLVRRDVLLKELRFVEKQLGLKPTVRVLCPSCGKERNKAA